MKKFSYTAVDKESKVRSGIVEAADENQAANILREKGLIITLLEVKEEFSLDKIFRRFKGVPEMDKVIFTRQLATMIASGLPLSQALVILKNQARNQMMKDVITEVIRDIDSGMSLYQGLSRHPTVFSRIFVSLVKAGEASGSLDKVLTRTADTMEAEYKFKSETKGALIYPAIIVVVMFVVIGIIVFFVMPKLMVMYKDMGVELPLPTKILMGISDFATTKWYFVLGIFAIIIVAFRQFSSSLRGRYYLADTALGMPVFGKISQETQFGSLSRTLGMLIASGLPILEALDISRDTVGNLRIKEAIAKCSQQVERGAPLSRALKQNTIFPPMFYQLVSVGEETGTLDDVLEKISRFFEDEAGRAVKNISSAIEPIIMVLLGVAVAFLIVAVILPIYKLTTSF